MLKPMEIFRENYEQRGLAARKWRARGRKVIGYMCNAVPEEMILAAGALIIRLSYEGVMQLVELFKGTIIDWNDAYMTRDVNPLRIAVSFIPVVLFFSSCDRKKMGKTQEFYINGLFFNAFAMLASMGSAYFGRIGIYTGAMTCIGYGYLFQLIPKGKHKNIVITVLFIVLVAYWIYSLQSDSLHSFNWVFNR